MASLYRCGPQDTDGYQFASAPPRDEGTSLSAALFIGEVEPLPATWEFMAAGNRACAVIC